MRDLKRLQAVHLDLGGRSYRIRTDVEGAAYQAFKASGVQPPGRVTMPNWMLSKSQMCSATNPKTLNLKLSKISLI